jgi:uncharacterized protein (TIGR00297 family)
MMAQLVTAGIISVVVVALAVWRGSLSRSGAVGALLIGVLTYGLGGPVWGVVLGIFFVSSSLLSHFKEEEKRAAAEKFDKGHRRDLGQVLANGGLGAVLATLSALAPSSIWFFLYVGVMATVTADTWATELGTLSRRPPRLITTGQIVEVGTSGGVSLLGTTVSLLGGLLIGLIAGLLQWRRGEKMLARAALAGALGGLTGSLVDSLLGATVQRIYYCDTCEKDTERQIHKCGTTTRPVRGWAWLNNDMVNFLSSIVGGAVAVAVGLLLSRKRGE